MSNPTIVASRIYKGQLEGKPGEETELEFEKFPFTALSKVLFHQDSVDFLSFYLRKSH